MAAVVKFDFSKLIGAHTELIAQLGNKDISVRPIAVEMVGIMHKRIHTDGKASDDSQIGTYSSGYLQKRKANKLGSDTRIIAVFTRKTSNSWTAFPTDRGWSVGFVDQDADGLTALKKIRYIEEMKGKKILDLSKFELQYSKERIIEIATEIINNFNKK